ncbi:hypothetical protein EVAR_41211_1 [Eumeta japonica]|uniref:Reverse transcriptase domain-containing protein n=1 Tax=Eumeta variegata TaxID=151549 RepID=A0A4C1W4T1_EUMVA|nr:hypothetical protein EVAR_41211_1 [Eumeta japonica]
MKVVNFLLKEVYARRSDITKNIFSGARNDFQKSELDQNGLNINGENLNHLRFADDLILFSEDARTLEIMLQQLSDESVKADMALTELQENKLKVCQNSMERSILGIKRSDGVKLEIIKKKTKFKMFTQPIDRSNGVGRDICQENIEKWSRLVTEWYPRDGKK